MKKLLHSWGSYQTGLKFLIIVLLVLGVFFRFANLDKKFYWNDEAVNSLRASGYTEAELFQQVFNGHVIGIEDLQKYQYPNPEKGLTDILKSLAVEEPQSPPIYYLITRFWMQWFGHSVAVMRTLPAVISLLAFPCIYWLCLELFESQLTGWIAIALIAVSPFHVLYAQEARLYSLWTVTILLSTAALLQAMRLKTKLSWITYAVSLVIGLYTFPFSGLVAISHGIYIVLMERSRLSKTLLAYLLSFLAALIAYAPWLFFIAINSHKMSPYRTKEVGILALVAKWFLNLSRVFLDLNLDSSNISSANPLLYIAILLTLPLVILLGYSFYFLYRQTPRRVWLFILMLIGTTALALVLPDLILGGRRSGVPRYLIPCYLGIQLAVAHLLATQISSFSASNWQRRLWQLLLITLVSYGLLSCAISAQAKTWWNKGEADIYFQIAPIVNQATQPLLISDGDNQYEGTEVSFSYLLKPKVRLLLVFKPNIPKIQIPEGFSDIFVFDPSQELLDQLEQVQNYKLEPTSRNKNVLWRLKK
jgi:uncharacterized membrane protein